MRQYLCRRIVVFLFLILTVLPATAAPRPEETGLSFFARIVRVVKQLLPLNTNDLNYPKP